MNSGKTSILIVEDEESVRTSLAQVFEALGYRTRSAADGLAAVIQMRQEVPDLLLSDLNMPAMSGFELLSVVRRRFPGMQVVAMSGVYAGEEVPYGVTADGFYQKGHGVSALLKAIASSPVANRPQRDASNPIWIQRNGCGTSGGEFVTIACPECCRTFPLSISGKGGLVLVLETSCIFCDNRLLCAVLEADTNVLPQPWQRGCDRAGATAPLNWSPIQSPGRDLNSN